MDPTALLFLLVAGVAFYFLIIRPGKQRQQQQQRLVSALAPGVEVMTTAGVFGTVAAVSEDQISLEIYPGVFMRILPAAVARVIDAPADDSAQEDRSEGDATDGGSPT